MREFDNIDDIQWWATQSLKREEAATKAEETFKATGKVVGPSREEWQEYPCDICAKRVGDTGHLELSTAESYEIKFVVMFVHCAQCRVAWMRMREKNQFQPPPRGNL